MITSRLTGRAGGPALVMLVAALLSLPPSGGYAQQDGGWQDSMPENAQTDTGPYGEPQPFEAPMADDEMGMEMTPDPYAAEDDWAEQETLPDNDDEPTARLGAMPVITAGAGAMANALSAGEGAALPQVSSLNTQPVVVELFTSQGCSSCPPADAMLADLAGMSNVLPLAFHVDYWDYLGWADSFARPEFTARQEAYARAAGERAIYTPQLIVEGQDTAVSLRPADLMSLIEAHRTMPAALNVERQRGEDGRDVIELYPLSDLGGRVSVILVRYAPRRQVEVLAGENRGRNIDSHNVVLDMQPLADWDGAAPLRLTVRSGDTADDSFPEDTRHAIMVQQMIGKMGLPGPILAAMRLD